MLAYEPPYHCGRASDDGARHNRSRHIVALVTQQRSSTQFSARLGRQLKGRPKRGYGGTGPENSAMAAFRQWLCLIASGEPHSKSKSVRLLSGSKWGRAGSPVRQALRNVYYFETQRLLEPDGSRVLPPL